MPNTIHASALGLTGTAAFLCGFGRTGERRGETKLKILFMLCAAYIGSK
jgi:hypothetical protein